MYERVEIIDERGVEHIYVYESEEAANTGRPFIEKYERWPEGTPNWQGFMNRLDLQTETNPDGTGLFEYMLSINSLLAWQGYNLCLQFTKLPKDKVSETEIRTLNYIYSVLSESLNEERKQQLVNALLDFNIPIQIEN